MLDKNNAPDLLVNCLKHLVDAIKPLAAIADEYDANGLEECRPDWVERGLEEKDPNKELYCNRGGKALIRLRDAMSARVALAEVNALLSSIRKKESRHA